MRKLLLAAVAATALAVSAPALAADPTTGGTATISNGVATLVSNTSVANTPADDFGYVQLPLPAGLTLAQITELSAEFNVTDDECSGGSPRFEINYGVNRNMFVYFGPSPSSEFAGCTANTWLSTGNVVGNSDAGRNDTAQLTGGSYGTSWAAAVALVGTQPINYIRVVVDGGWKFADGEQTVMLRNVKLNGATFLTPTQPGGGGPRLNPTTACKAQQAALGRTAFNELWAKTGTMNGFGKCVSTAAKAQNVSQQSLSTMQSRIMNAAKTCKAKGLKGEKLGQCVAATDRVAATLTEAQENKGKAKGRR